MTYTTVRNGSRGGDVSTLQQLLNEKGGYNLAVDGIFGNKTLAAVQDYQGKNNLTVDGIVGTNTWGSLTGGGTAPGGGSASGKTTAEFLADYEGNRPEYAPSQAVQDALAQLQGIESNKPGEYTSKYAEQIDSLLNNILNREDFSYDFNADPLYQQYKDNYTQQGKMAMMDTMGQAAALTGGYGNSYAQAVGQQAYQGHLSQLNNVIPELQAAAYNMYRDEGTDMLNNIGLLTGLDETDYGRHRDTVGDWKDELAYYYTKHGDMSATDYNKYLNDAAAWENDRDYYYKKTQDEQAQSNWREELNFAQQQAARGSSSGGSGGSSGGGNSKSPGSNSSETYTLRKSSGRGETIYQVIDANGKQVYTSNSYSDIQKKYPGAM
ncbi:MAG TPA: hypothetical protein DEB31_05495 [Clostridiales bacterium]|nr:hypothetical protein [Clostridiales bacterium]